MAALTSRLVGAIAGIAKRFKFVSSRANKLMINAMVNTCRERPHPWSTVHDYISWTSLTDKTWSARHLPAWEQPNNLPSPEKVVELFQRGVGAGQQYSTKSTLLFPAFAQYLTDGFIRTRMPHEGDDPAIRLRNSSNHEIDLCTLYGRLAEQTAALRLGSVHAGERGRLKSQQLKGEEYSPFLFDDNLEIVAGFAGLDLPLGLGTTTDDDVKRNLFAVGGDRVNAAPQVSMINTLLLREHNRLAGELERANPSWDDERVFETTRNCLIFMFIKIVVEEYINHVSNAPFDFVADPSVAWDQKWNKPNWITTEFSLLYRWHSLIPDEVDWGGETVAVETTFMDNRFLLAGGLRQAFVDVSGQRSGTLGARNTTPALLPIEKAAIEQGRLARLAPYVEYKRYMGSKPPTRFDQVSSDPDVQATLQRIYERVEDIDFYAGLFAEDLEADSPLPDLILKMVAADAFSQALTNPLLSKHVIANKHDAFSKIGWKTISKTKSLRDLLDRNHDGGLGTAHIGMTQPGWRPGD
jgi:prostaglandin-endoperoxide synthase 2